MWDAHKFRKEFENFRHCLCCQVALAKHSKLSWCFENSHIFQILRVFVTKLIPWQIQKESSFTKCVEKICFKILKWLSEDLQNLKSNFFTHFRHRSFWQGKIIKLPLWWSSYGKTNLLKKCTCLTFFMSMNFSVEVITFCFQLGSHSSFKTIGVLFLVKMQRRLIKSSLCCAFLCQFLHSWSVQFSALHWLPKV